VDEDVGEKDSMLHRDSDAQQASMWLGRILEASQEDEVIDVTLDRGCFLHQTPYDSSCPPPLVWLY